ncbi:SIR2 family protein [Vibrio harveyi]|uniref:SIR2 family protein n=1 Tax=Vibrio harveyi TaxID=669 RepID=UPI0018F265CB|nr:SIR2 family protein [Vibrio harveyi]
MKVLNKSFDGLNIKYKGHLAASPWTLCVGAGVSFGLVPTWYELTKNVVNDAFGWSCSADDFDNIAEGTKWSLDSLLQGASNKLEMEGFDSDEFYNLLEKHLYQDLLDTMETPLLTGALKKGLSNPRNLSKEEILALVDYFETNHATSTLNQLAHVLSKAHGKGQLPMSVINFNADTLLHLLIEIKYIASNNSGSSWEQPSAQFVKSFRGVQTSSKDVVPIHHCHGAISPTNNGLKKNKDSRQNIVFRESEYLEIAGTASTWAQTLCLYHAQNSKFLIIGHSLSDPNIRKWLAWSHQNHLKELEQLLPAHKKDQAVSPRHIWINVKPQDPIQQELMEISLLHIGVRICWIESWDQVESVMGNLLAL